MLTPEKLREMLMYDENTGVFRWRVRPTIRSKVRAGDIAGCRDNRRGNVLIKVPGEPLHQAHRLAWLYVYGEWPKQHIDHINGNPSDNRIENLRDVSPQINAQNKRKIMVTNKSSGFLGVTFCKKAQKFQAQITFNKKCFYLGLFDDPKEAHLAYLKAKRKIHEGNTL